MKVGYFLKEEIKDIPGLKYTYKIIISDDDIHTGQKKLENKIFFENCNTFLNNIHSGNSLDIKNRKRSHSQKQNLKFSKSSNKKLFLKLNNSKNLISNILNEKLPNLKTSTPKKKKIKTYSNKNILSPIIKENDLIKNKLDNYKKEENRIKSFTIIPNKNRNISNLKFRENYLSKTMRTENIFNKKSKKKEINILGFRIQNKFKTINRIINKLNTPIFLYNKIEIN